MKNSNMQELDEQEKEVHISKLSDLKRVIKNGSTLLKLWLFFDAIFFLSIVAMVLFAVLTK